MNNFLDEDKAVLNEHLKLVHKIAWQLHEQTGYDLDDLFSEGCLQYLLKKESYKPSKNTKLTTYLWVALRNKLLDYIRDSSKVVLVMEEELMDLFHPKPPVRDVFEHHAF